MLRFVTFLTVLLYVSLSLGQQTGVFQTLKLLPTTLPITCNPGDIKTKSSTSVPNYCSATNTWSALGGASAATTISTTQNVVNSTFYPLFVPSSTNGQQATSLSTGFSINPSTDVVTATTFSGALSGNATSATTATNATSSTNATNVSTTNTNTNSSFFPTFVSTTTNGNQLERVTSGFSVNPSTDVVTATTFSGALSGNATSATTATNSTNSTNVGTTNTNTSSSFFPTFVSSTTNGNQLERVTSGFSVNPSTDVVTATTFVGALTGTASLATSATTATNATNVGTTQVSNNASYFPLIVSTSANGNKAADLMTGFTFNPGTDVLVAGGYVTGYTTTVTAAGTTTITNTSTQQQFFTGSTTQTLKLPVTSTLALGQTYVVVNNSSGIVTVQSSGANTVQAMAGSTFATFTVILTSGTTAASWAVEYTPPAGTPTFSGLTQWGAMYANTTTTIASTATGIAGDVLVSNGSAAPSYLGAVAASFYASASGTTSTTQTINFDTKVYDTNNAVTVSAAGTGTWKFTAPVTGYYHVGGWLGFFTQHYFDIYKNGTIFANIGTTDANGFSEGVSYDIQLNSGEFIDIRADSSNTWVGGSPTPQGGACKIVIHLIK